MSVYEQVAESAAKLSDDELLAELKRHADSLSALWRESDKRAEPKHVGVGGNVVRDTTYGKKLFVDVHLSSRGYVHVSAIRGEKIAL